MSGPEARTRQEIAGRKLALAGRNVKDSPQGERLDLSEGEIVDVLLEIRERPKNPTAG